MTDGQDDAWVTGPHDTRERTCGQAIAPVFSVRHAFHVARDPAPPGVTVTRTYEATVEWTSDLDLPAWLSAVADVLTPYDADRFGVGDEPRSDPTADGRFLAAPVEATVRPGGSGPIQSEPYHYWNTPLARLQADDGYPGAVVSTTLDLVDGPEAVWTGTSMAGGIDVGSLERDLEAYSRVGVAVTGRERFRRPSPEAGTENEDERGPHDWERVGERSVIECSWLESIVGATIAPEVRSMGDRSETAPDRDPIAGPVGAVEERIDAAWAAFERSSGGGDGTTVEPETGPYRVPEAAIRAALDREDNPT
jgi:hypothetical protein